MYEEERYRSQEQQRPFWETAGHDDLATITYRSLNVALSDHLDSGLRIVLTDRHACEQRV
jgi:hypothetical protein